MESITFSDLHVIAGPSVTPHGARGGSPSLSRTFFSPSRFRSPVPLVALRRRPAHAAITTNSVPVDIYSIRSFDSSLMVGRYLCCHDDTRWWQGHHYPTGGLTEIVVTERGPWQAVVITCKTCFTSVNDPDNLRIEEARHVYPDGGDPDDNACHVSP
ncbi:hypothetical protein CK203_069888 [Vitis vinifera]|uniref:Uncharacterized protein n=1 Tax=Vitis vinifera TaxID=29760 RepID=A0A438EPW1_VITVI|nr:hypothetical protein CK203_069888 [Vitis vinifera]